MDSVEKLVAYYGSVKNVAEAAGRTRVAVWHWRKVGIPIELAMKFNADSKGKLKLSELRPDIWAK